MDGNIKIETTENGYLLRICGDRFYLPDRWAADALADALDNSEERKIRIPDTDGYLDVCPVLGGPIGTRLVCLKDWAGRVMLAAVVDGWEIARAIRSVIREAA